MVVGIGVIDIHVLEEPSDVLIKEALDLAVVEFRVYKESANVGLHNVRERLRDVLATRTWLFESSHDTFGAVFVKVQ